MGDIRLFQMDLQTGMSLEDALIKHNLDLPTAISKIHKPLTKNRKYQGRKAKPTEYASKYIQKNGNSYHLRKNIDGKTKMFGAYATLEEAEAVKKEMERIGWKQRSVDRVCKELGVKRIQSKKKGKARYH